MKKILSLCLCFFIIITMPVSGEVVYDWDMLLGLYNQQNKLEEEINLDFELKKSNYNSILEEYADLEKVIKDLEDMMTIAQMHMDQVLEEVEETDDGEKVKVGPYGFEMDKVEYLMKYEYAGYGYQYEYAKDAYGDVVKGQLALYKDMELLKVQLDYAEEIRVQELVEAENDFQQIVYEYMLAKHELELLKLEQRILGDQLDTVKIKADQGNVTLVEVHKKENELIALEERITLVENNIEQNYMTIKQILGLSSSDIPELTIELESTNELEVIDFDDYKNIATANNVNLYTLQRQLQICDELDFMTQAAYDEKEDAYQIQVLKNEQMRMETQKLIQQTDMMIDQAYYNYMIAVDQFRLDQQMFELGVHTFEMNEAKYNLGHLSDSEWQQVKLEYQTILYNYEKAKVNYIKAVNQFEEALYGIVI